MELMGFRHWMSALYLTLSSSGWDINTSFRSFSVTRFLILSRRRNAVATQNSSPPPFSFHSFPRTGPTTILRARRWNLGCSFRWWWAAAGHIFTSHKRWFTRNKIGGLACLSFEMQRRVPMERRVGLLYGLGGFRDLHRASRDWAVWQGCSRSAFYARPSYTINESNVLSPSGSVGVLASSYMGSRHRNLKLIALLSNSWLPARCCPLNSFDIPETGERGSPHDVLVMCPLQCNKPPTWSLASWDTHGWQGNCACEVLCIGQGGRATMMVPVDR
ncbi:hypothetical protein BT67DRAFT_282449 [Trichocladium antarcticum]|uniref:Uncharacterized protein n=1 Tax=Trichocladium antarcticum TaxID=1450529 RepID=A0AAN6UL97_9PEZI|nr:hypothetical protein BT67DRAFT_282449 [Trichocladium antarcticum]